MQMVDLIIKKREGKRLKASELEYFVKGVASDTIPDYQISAMLMAMFLNGLTPEETCDLTLLMAQSGDICDLSGIDGIKVDKHSTGGVGDKTTLIICPIAAACGVKIAKMSGRGLGHTGGTIDKLESIEGYKTSLPVKSLIESVNKIGISLIGQSDRLCIADKKLYAMRDVTGTVESIPLIAASIMSKKIATGADKILLDVKAGSGAFAKTLDEAKALSRAMIEIGRLAKKETCALITNMDVPLGINIGNRLEVEESVEVLKGEGPQDLVDISSELSCHMLSLGGIGETDEERKIMIREVIKSGKALDKFYELIKNQGGKISNGEIKYVSSPKEQKEIRAWEDGLITGIDTYLVGKASLALGAGRAKKEDQIDYGAGLKLVRKTGDKIKKDDLVAVIYASSNERLSEGEKILKSAFKMNEKGYIKGKTSLAFLSENEEIIY